MSAQHELGKAYTALAHAWLALGRLREAGDTLDLAFAALERAKYRSGRARAELVRAFLLARRGLPDQAAASARWVIAELLAVEVYPTLVILAARLLEALGQGDERLRQAAAEAEETVGQAIADRTHEHLIRLLGLDPHAAYAAATRTPDAAAGFYNHNVGVGELLVRIPIAGAHGMDLKIWKENEILAALAVHVEDVPRLRFACTEPTFQVHDFVPGDVLDTIAPRGSRVPAHVLGDTVALFCHLAGIPFRALPALPSGWPEDRDTTGFARGLSALTGQVYERFRHEHQAEFTRLGIPAEPLAPIRWESLTSRPFGLVHSDVHRKNMIVSNDRTIVLDWELALWGDPVYELAVHLHKMAYYDDEREAVTAEWVRLMPTPMTYGWEADLATYLAHERIKSAIVDTVRYTELVRSARQTPEEDRDLIRKLTGKLNAAGAYWCWSRPIAHDLVDHVVRDSG